MNENQHCFVVDEFKNVFPSDPQEREALKSEIAKDGKCRDPLVLAKIDGEEKTPIADGHTRYDIIAELRAQGVDVETPNCVVKEFKDRSEVIDWIMTNQFARRNTSPAERIETVLRNQPLIDRLRAEAKARQGQRNDLNIGAEKPQGQNGKVADALANRALVSTSTWKKGARVFEAAKVDPKAAEIADQLRRKEISLEEAAKNVRSAENDRKMVLRAERARELRKPYLLVEDDGQPFTKDSDYGRILTGDNLDQMERIPDGAVTMFVFSPPYPIDEQRVGYDFYKYPGYLVWKEDLRLRLRTMYRKLRVGGRVAMNLDLTSDRQKGQATKYPALADAIQIAREEGFEILDQIEWYKQTASGDRPNWGTYADPTMPNVRRVNEPVVFFYKGTPRLEGDDALCDMIPGDFEHATISTWNYDVKTNQAADLVVDSFWYVPPHKRKHEAEHPCPFPERLLELILKIWTRRGDLIVDPYCGSGTTCVVAQRLGRRFLGIDLSDNYCAESRKRLADQIAEQQQINGQQQFNGHERPDAERQN